MRGTSNDQIIHKNKDGRFIGVGLGSDFCAEHEWGTEEIQRKFGIPACKQERGGWGKIVALVADTMPLGADKYTVSQGEVYTFEKTAEVTDYGTRKVEKGRIVRDAKYKLKLYGLTSYDPSQQEKWGTPKAKVLESITREAHIYFREDPLKRVFAAWDSKDFLFMIESEEDRDALVKAFQEKDIVMFLGGVGGFSNGTYNIFIKSRLPAEVITQMREDDLDHRAMMKAFKATGIEERLRDAKCTYFALSPRWKGDSKTELQFWLNPQEQHRNNCGWFTIADLEDWMKGTGKIPMTKEQKDKRRF
jgi:hypothetical protein